MKHTNLIKRLVKEILAKYTHDCGCGCHGKCGKAPMLNENLSAKITMTENMSYHINNKKPLTENTFRYGSDAFLDLWAEARYLYSRNAIHLLGEDKKIITETNLGEYGIFEGQKVPLDLVMEDESTFSYYFENAKEKLSKPHKITNVLYKKTNRGDKYIQINYKLTFMPGIQYDPEGHFVSIFYDNDEQLNLIKKEFGLNLTEGKINESEYQGKKVQLNKPKRGGSKKFYVYVRDPKTKKVKKVSFGAAGGGQNLAVKIRDPKARKAFAKRQQCDKKKDRTTPGYWSCNIGRYWKSLGGGSNFSGYW